MKKIILAAANVILLVGLGVFGGYFFMKYQDLKNNPMSAEQAAKDQATKTIEEVGRLYDLPDDEEPSIAAVNDKDKLQDQQFFAKAENGDVTLIYSNAKLAILYRPSSKQIINVSSVTIQGNVRIKVIGGEESRKAAIAKLAAGQVTATDGGSAKTTITAVTVVDISGKNVEQAKSVATALGASVGALPEGEEKPADADILVLTN